jgi:hypothetical protein
VRTRELLRKLRNRRVLLPAGLVVVLVLSTVGWVGYRGTRAADHLGTAARLFVQLKEQVSAGDAGSARRTLAALRRETGAARDETGGPMWSMASALPKLGDDLAAARTIADALDELATDGLPPLIDAASGLEAAVLAPRHGTVDLAAIQAAAPGVAKATAVIKDVRARIARIRVAGLDPRISGRIPQLLAALQKAEQLAGPAGQAMTLLPSMLGAGGPRTYLVIVQNLAEVRASGGMPGSYLVIEANHGAISVVDKGSAAYTLRTFATPVLPLDEDAEDLFTTRLGTFAADVNLTPDFPTTATIVREMYRVRTGRTVDGVLSVDPVALSYLLRATGPVPIPGYAPLSAADAVPQLLNGVYLRTPDPKAQDAYFQTVAGSVFAALFTQHGDPRAEVAGLARAAGERRLLMWSAHPQEQQEIATTVLGGILPTDDGAHPSVGVFLNDGSGAKLGYYMRRAVSLSVGQCLEDGTRELKVKVVLTSVAPKSGLPQAVTGLALAGDPYTIRTNILVYAPTGGTPVAATLDGAEADAGSGVDRGRAVSVVTVDLPPGGTRTLELSLITDTLPDPAAPLTPRLVLTPGLTPWKTTIESGPGCPK